MTNPFSNILKEYISEDDIHNLYTSGKFKTNKINDMVRLGSKFTFSYWKEEDTPCLKITARLKSNIIRLDSVCSEHIIDKQTILFEGSCLKKKTLKQLKKDISTFFRIYIKTNYSSLED